MNTSEPSQHSPPKPHCVEDAMVSQDSICNQIQRSLSCLGYSQLNNVHCSIDADVITLTGQLDSFYLKQVAQSVAVKVAGRHNVCNDIQVIQ